MTGIYRYFMKWRKGFRYVFYLYFIFLTFLLLWWKADRQLFLGHKKARESGQARLVPTADATGGFVKAEAILRESQSKHLGNLNASGIFSWGELDDGFQKQYFGKTKELCNGRIIGINSVFALLVNVTIDPKCGHGRLGGENISSVINQKEDDEYFKLDKGYFNINCKDGFSYAFTPKSHLNKWRDSTSTDSELPKERKVVSDWTIAIMRYEYANLYHTMTDYYAAFLVAKMYKMELDKVTIFWIDGHPTGALDKTWKRLFGNITRAGELQTPVLFKRMLWGIMGYDSLLNKHDTPVVPYLEEFRSFFLLRHGLTDKTYLNCTQLNVMFMWRRDYLAHPRNPTGKVTRKIKNEDELITSVKELLPGHKVTGLQIDKFPMKKQLQLISTTDILIGMHGAGLSHTLFLPKHAGLVELFPTYWPAANKHFRSMARWRHLHYATWSNTDHSRELPNHYTIVDVNKVINMVHEIHHKLCGAHADDGGLH